MSWFALLRRCSPALIAVGAASCANEPRHAPPSTVSSAPAPPAHAPTAAPLIAPPPSPLASAPADPSAAERTPAPASAASAPSADESAAPKLFGPDGKLLEQTNELPSTSSPSFG